MHRFNTLSLEGEFNLVRPYNGNGDGQNFYSWIRILSHEVGHLKHIEECGNIAKYGASFIWDYVSNFSHDNVPREIEAEKGRTVFNDFNRFVNKTNNSRTAIADLFNSDKSDKVKIDILNKWWQEFISSKIKNKSE